MNGYFKKERQKMVEITSNDLPENALEWAAVLKADDPKFSYRFVNT